MLEFTDNPPTDRREYETWRIAELENVKPLIVQALEAERLIIRRTIDLCQGDREEAALRLGIARTTLYRKLGRKA